MCVLDGVTDAAAKLLWEKRISLPILGPVLKDTLFRVHDEKLSQVVQLCDYIESELGIKPVKRFGTKDALPTEEFDVAFIDYRFGPSRQKESVDRAVRWATHLYRKGEAFIILMSAEVEARVSQDLFRKASNLTRGLFEFLDKKEIADSGKFCNRLNSFCAGLDTRHEIHHFASAAEEAVGEAAKSLLDAIHALGLEDYAYLEQISLREDGHPLGDYMLWLFGEYFGHKLSANESLQPARKRLNGLKYERFLPLQRPPSVMLATMYSAAITEPVHEGWEPHPREVQEEQSQEAPAEAVAADQTGTETPTKSSPQPQTADSLAKGVAQDQDTAPVPQNAQAAAPPAETSATAAEGAPSTEMSAVATASPSVKGLPQYQLGDLLVADKTKHAYLILNAGCDLQFSPGTKRVCDPLRTILLLPGKLEPLYERGEEESVKRTELFEIGEERFRIIWLHTRAVAVPYHKVRSQYEPDGYSRKWRLKLPYALEVQQHFAAQLTRVGVPTPTPLFRERPVEAYGRSASGNCHHLGTVKNGAIVFHHKQHDQFVLTVDCVHELLGFIDGFATVVEGEVQPVAGATPSEDEKKKADRRKKYLADLREARQALAHTCRFQDELTTLPTASAPAIQIDELSKTDKRHRLEVRLAATLTGKYTANAPIIVAFALPDIAGAVSEDPVEPATGDGDTQPNTTAEEHAQV